MSGIAKSRILIIECDRESGKIGTAGKRNRMWPDWEREASDGVDSGKRGAGVD